MQSDTAPTTTPAAQQPLQITKDLLKTWGPCATRQDHNAPRDFGGAEFRL